MQTEPRLILLKDGPTDETMIQSNVPLDPLSLIDAINEIADHYYCRSGVNPDLLVIPFQIKGNFIFALSKIGGPNTNRSMDPRDWRDIKYRGMLVVFGECSEVLVRGRI